MKGFKDCTTPDGDPLQLVTLSDSNDLQVTMMNWGATCISCRFHGREMLHRAPDFDAHLQQQVYLGATVGRYANRIRNGRFELGGKSVQLNCNEGNHHLHGGITGFDRRTWEIVQSGPAAVTFTYQSAPGEEGYPGNLSVTADYAIEGTTLIATFEAQSDDDTPVNITNHSYFNLSGEPDISSHALQLHAAQYQPVDDKLLPAGSPVPVSGTGMDYRRPKPLEDTKLDHAFLIRNDRTPAMRAAATLTGGDIRLEIETEKPALQVYTGERSGIAMEPQFMPDSPNRDGVLHESSILKAGTRYRYQTRYRFTRLRSHPE